jgi:hypothetical protein
MGTRATNRGRDKKDIQRKGQGQEIVDRDTSDRQKPGQKRQMLNETGATDRDRDRCDRQGQER